MENSILAIIALILFYAIVREVWLNKNMWRGQRFSAFWMGKVREAFTRKHKGKLVFKIPKGYKAVLVGGGGGAPNGGEGFATGGAGGSTSAIVQVVSHQPRKVKSPPTPYPSHTLYEIIKAAAKPVVLPPFSPKEIKELKKAFKKAKAKTNRRETIELVKRIKSDRKNKVVGRIQTIEGGFTIHRDRAATAKPKRRK